jgi:hypothetical protein
MEGGLEEDLGVMGGKSHPHHHPEMDLGNLKEILQ